MTGRTPLAPTRRAVLLGVVGLGATASACGGRDAPSSTGSAGGAASGSPSPSIAAAAAEPRVLGPEGGPAVLVVHAWWGVTPGVLHWAEALAGAGARVVVPDLYAGAVATTVDEAQSMADALDPATVTSVLAEAVARFDGEAFDALGWSLGAFQTCGLMGRSETAPRRAVLFYGGAPLSGATTTEGVQLHLVPDDPYFTDGEVDAVLAGFDSAGVAVERFDYPGQQHWFAEPGSPAYDEEAAATARRRALAHLGLAGG